MKQAELIELVDAVIDGNCSEADFLRLEAELHIDPEARQLYYDRLQLHTLLESGERSQAKKPSAKRTLSRRQILVMASVVAFFFAMVPSFFSKKSDKPSDVVATEPLADGFGVLALQDEAIWGQGQNLNTGDLVSGQRLVLENGLAQLELFSGVTVVVQGKADFQVHSDMEMTVHSGRLRAIVPKPARGFRIKTTNGDIVDLGTEFAIDVQDTHAELHVLEGEIEWHPVQDQVRLLGDGESLRWADGKANHAETRSDDFAGLVLLEEKTQQNYREWLDHTQTLASDSRLLAYYPMTNPIGKSRSLVDETTSGREGLVVRSKGTLDRWGNPNQALDFSPTGSRVRVDIPGEHDAISLFCWVRIDSLDKWFNSLFLTDGHELNEPHWQIMNDGRIFFSVKARQWSKGKPDKKVVYSPSFWTPQLSGQWIQLAAVFDSSDQTISHYINGERVARETLPEEYQVDKVKIGPASIANWSEPQRTDPEFAVRNLNGAIDEFAIFGEALSGEEIKALYLKGRF